MRVATDQDSDNVWNRVPFPKQIGSLDVPEVVVPIGRVFGHDEPTRASAYKHSADGETKVETVSSEEVTHWGFVYRKRWGGCLELRSFGILVKSSSDRVRSIDMARGRASEVFCRPYGTGGSVRGRFPVLKHWAIF